MVKSVIKQQTVDQKAVVTLLDVAGSCITDIVFNHLYDRAIAVHEKTSKGLAECYRQTLGDYIKESNSARFYSVLLNSVHHYTRMSTIYNDLSYPDCVNLYASLFVPQMYIVSLTAEQKLNILSMIFGSTVRKFAAAIIRQYIRCIIDDHNDPSNIEELQDCVLKILLHERDLSYERFIQSQKPTHKQSAKTKAKLPARSMAMVKLTAAFKKSVTDRALLKKRNNALTRKHDMLAKQFEDLKTMFLNQLSIHKEQTKAFDNLKQQLARSAQVAKSASSNDGSESGEGSSEQTADSDADASTTSPIHKHELKSAPVPEDEDDDELFSVQYV